MFVKSGLRGRAQTQQKTQQNHKKQKGFQTGRQGVHAAQDDPGNPHLGRAESPDHSSGAAADGGRSGGGGQLRSGEGRVRGVRIGEREDRD